MDRHLLKQRLDWFSVNAPYKRGMELIETAGGRVHGLLYYLWSNSDTPGELLYVKRNSMQSANSIDLETMLGFHYSGYVSFDEVRSLFTAIRCDRGFAGVSTYDSVNHMMDMILRAHYEAQVVLSERDKSTMDKLYYGVKHYQEMFIVNNYPEWWGS